MSNSNLLFSVMKEENNGDKILISFFSTYKEATWACDTLNELLAIARARKDADNRLPKRYYTEGNQLMKVWLLYRHSRIVDVFTTHNDVEPDQLTFTRLAVRGYSLVEKTPVMNDILKGSTLDYQIKRSVLKDNMCDENQEEWPDVLR
jgi:hypothetical protein